MVLNVIWSLFFIAAFLLGLDQWIDGDAEAFPRIVKAMWDMTETAFELAIYLTGGMCLWLGMMRIAEQAGLIRVLARLVAPFFSRLFPEVPREHPAIGHMLMNISANMLGLDNAATPLGLKAMQSLQELNPGKETASNAQIMFLVLNTSGLTLIPTSVMIIRAKEGAADPTDVFIPILLATFCSTLVGLVFVALKQRIRLYDPVMLAWLGGLTALAAGILFGFRSMEQDQVQAVASAWSNFIILGIIVAFITAGWVKRVNVYESFIEGAKEAFPVAVRIIPYLVGILVAIAAFRAAGGMEMIMSALRTPVKALGLPTEWVEAMPTGIMKPLSGSGARGMMVDAIGTHGVDSFVARLAGTMQGATETTFYVIAVYFGSVGIRKTRYAVTGGLIADAAGIIAAIFIAYLFFA